MLLIANNINYRDRQVREALVYNRSEFIRDLARRCAEAGANYLEIDLGHGRRNSPTQMQFAVEAVQEAVDLPLVLSADDPEALEAGLRLTKRTPVINYFSAETEKLEKVLPLAARYNAEIVALTVDWRVHADAPDCVALASVLVGAANSLGISNDRIWVDPAVIHLQSMIGQQHAAAIPEIIQTIASVFDPPVKTTCWLSNVSVGSATQIRPVIDSYFLATLAGAGLQSVFLNVLDEETMRAVRLVNAFRNEVIFADAMVQLQ